MTSDLSTNEILTKLRAEELFYRDKNVNSVNNNNVKSEVWLRFVEIVDANNKYIGYVACKNCDQIYKYNYKDGTSSLKRHVCRRALNNQPKITSFIENKMVPAIAKETTAKKIMEFVCKDLRPFEIINGSGFREFAQEMINIGSVHGCISIDNLLPHPTTVSRNVIKAAESIKSSLAGKLTDIFQKTGGAFTTDLWTDDYNKISYISLTVHYIENWDLKDQVLAAVKFPEDNHTAENTRRTVFNILRGYNLSPSVNMKRYAFVTDSGSNFVAAFRAYNHLACLAHRINTVLDTSFKENNFQLSSIINTIDGCKSLVTFFKQSSLYSKLEKTLKQESKTRWNSKLEMLESVYDQFETIYNLLEERDELYRLEDVDLQTLENLVIFLKKFKEASQCLEASKQPTLHLVIPWYKSLLMHCQINPSDHETLKQMKE
ncbi:4781_t:CDS:2, partial [Entrophospora sp. SA101]